MNIGKEPQTSINESNSVSILKTRLQENGFIKCYFSEGDKTPNTDGFFVANNEFYPLKEFHVQIKKTDSLKTTKGMKVYSCDTKFINYANLEVTENPCFIFVVELKTKNIYFKFLSEKFLQDNDFTRSNQKKVSIHFGSGEVLEDIKAFYSLICDIIKFREIKRFNPKEIDVVEYQYAFDILNNFFDKDFIKIKNMLYPNTWKFGIAYQRTTYENADYKELLKERTEMGISVVPYVSSFGAYSIEYGDKQQIFQNINVFENDATLKLLHNISFTNGVSSTVEQAVLSWLNSVFDEWITNEQLFVRFLPNDALFEVVYNFLDKNSFEISKGNNAENLIGNTISTEEAKIIINKKYPINSYVNSEILLLKKSIIEIERRKVNFINRVWLFESNPQNHIRNIYYKSCTPIIDNNKKFLLNLPKYYGEFINNLFSESNVKMYAYTGKFQIMLNVNLTGNYLNNEYKSVVIESDEFTVEIVDELNATANCMGGGLLHTSFKGDKTNILTNLLSMLYERVSTRFKFKQNLSFIGKVFFH